MRKSEMSPLRLLQEIYHPNEWKILVCCMMLNQTTGTQVHQVIKDLFAKYPNPKSLANAKKKDLVKIIKSCGLYNRRADLLIRFSQEYMWKNWSEPMELTGIGRYAQDSYDIFVRKLSVKPSDKELKKYVKWIETGQI